MNNIIKRKWNQNSMVIIEDLQGMAFQAESGGHTFQISGVDGEGNAVALSGTPAGVLLRADGQDVTLTCSVSGGVVSATLPANAYVVPGRFGLTIFLTSDGQKTAIYAAVGTVGKTSSGTVAPPAGSDVVTLVNQINTAIAAIPANYNACFAPAYSTSGLYSVGQYVTYNGYLYRCNTAITTAESWTASHWTQTNLGADVYDLKSALYSNAIEKITAFPSNALRNNYGLNSAGKYASVSNSVGGNSTRASGGYIAFVQLGSYITVNAGYKATFAIWDTIPVNTSLSTTHRTEFVDVTGGNTHYFSHEGYLLFAISKSDGSAFSEDIDTFVANAIVLNLYTRGANEIALSAENKLNGVCDYDAQINPSFFATKKRVVMPTNVVPLKNYTSGYYIKPDGTLVANSGYKTSDYFIIEPTTQYTVASSNSTLCFYDVNKNHISGKDLGANGTITSPSNAAYARYSTNADPTYWNVSKGSSVVSGAVYFEPYFGEEFATSGYNKGNFVIAKPDVSEWYECECLKENANAFGFVLGTNTAYTGTQYARVIELYDALVSDAETGYITKTELGTGAGTDQQGNAYKLYEYAFVPKKYTSTIANKKHPKILIDCSIHGFEKNSTFGIFSLMYDVVHNWTKNKFLETLRNYVEIRIVPVANPWGFDNNTRNNYNGVNLNRNFPADNWEYVESGNNASGDAPLDQPEAAILAQWFQNNADMWFYFNTHTNGHYYASGYAEANALMPYNNINDGYYNKMYNAFVRHIECQTAQLAEEFQSISPSYSQFIGKIQASATSGAGYADQYVCAYLKIALAMTLEGCNYLRIGETELGYNDGTIKMNAEMFGNTIEQLLYEYCN